MVNCSGRRPSISTAPFIELASNNCRRQGYKSKHLSQQNYSKSWKSNCRWNSFVKKASYLLNNLSGHSRVFQTVDLNRDPENKKLIEWIEFLEFLKVRLGEQRYLSGSKHVSKNRKQTPIADAETHAVLLENLKWKQLIGAHPFLYSAGTFVIAIAYTAQSADIAVCTPLVIEFAKARSIPNQVSLAGTTWPRRKRAGLLLPDIINNS